jgi:hypothetical protein
MSTYAPPALRFDINHYKNLYQLDNYIESGTGQGDSLSYMLNFNFKNYISIEIDAETHQSAIDNFKNKNCKIINGNSTDVLNDILKTIDGNTLFYLDAHYPGSGKLNWMDKGIDAEKNIDIRLPLEIELSIIIENYPFYKNSVIAIDDLRIYEDGPFDAGNWEDRTKSRLDGISFIHNMFSNTHNIQKEYTAGGSILLTPIV